MSNWNPEQYRQSSSMQLALAQEILERIALKGNERVLDLGCGDGKVTAALAQTLPQGSVVGIDSSPEMITYARHRFCGQKNLSFELQDACRLQFNQEFDIVISNSALHWVKDHVSVLQGINRSLKPGGKFILHIAGKGNAGEILSIADELMASVRWQQYFKDFTFPWSFYSAQEYKAVIKTAGLKPLRVELFPRHMQLNTKQDLYGWIQTTWLPYLDRIPNRQVQEAFIDAIVNEYLHRYPPDSQGVIRLLLIRLVAQGSKTPKS